MNPRISVRLTASDYVTLERVRVAYGLKGHTAALRKCLGIALAYQFEDPCALVTPDESGATRPFVFRANVRDQARLSSLWDRFTQEPGFKVRCAVRVAGQFRAGCMTLCGEANK